MVTLLAVPCCSILRIDFAEFINFVPLCNDRRFAYWKNWRRSVWAIATSCGSARTSSWCWLRVISLLQFNKYTIATCEYLLQKDQDFFIKIFFILMFEHCTWLDLSTSQASGSIWLSRCHIKCQTIKVFFCLSASRLQPIVWSH